MVPIAGIVFNVTRYMDFHPGGVGELMRGVGKDATKLFENVKSRALSNALMSLHRPAKR